MSTIKRFQRHLRYKHGEASLKPCSGCFNLCKDRQVATVMIMGFPNSVCAWHLEPLETTNEWSSLNFLARFTQGLPPGHKLLLEAKRQQQIA